MDYLDFELEIAAESGSEYPVTVIRSPAGEAHETMHFPFDEQALQNRLSILQQALLGSGDTNSQTPSTGKQTMHSFGQALFTALFTGEVGKLYAASWNVATSQGKGLRVKLRMQPPELAALPWEFLYDPDQAQYLCLSVKTPVVRYLEVPSPCQPLTVTSPLSILGMTASPEDLPELDVAREQQRIDTALAGLQAKGLAQVTWLQGRTWEDLQRAMLGGPWHIFHFIGHGGFNPDSNEGTIVLEDNAGQAHYLSATQLGMLLTDHHPLRLVVLNSCDGARGSTRDIFSSTAATLVRRGILAVLANQYEITDEAAIDLSRAFYETLAAGMPVDTAVGEARKAISLGEAQSVEWGTPVLSMHTPDGVLFDLAPSPSQSSSTPGDNSSGTVTGKPPTSQLPPSPPPPSKGPPTTQSNMPGLFSGSPILYIGLAILIIALILGSVGIIAANRIAADKARAMSLIAATATARSIANATAATAIDPYSPTYGKLPLNDSLSKPYKWDAYPTDSAGFTCQFSNGAYHVSESKPPHSPFCSETQTQFSNFAFEVQMTIIHGDCGGMVFRYDGTNLKYYYFEVCASGNYNLGVQFDNTHYKVLAYKSSPAITTGLNQLNTIAVVANGSTLDLYVNHQKIDSVSDSTYSEGYLGLEVDATANPTEVAFTNAKVWTL
jgi:CHAT domain-containing protein